MLGIHLTVHKAHKFKIIRYNKEIDFEFCYGLGCLWVKILAFHQRELENRVRVAAEAIVFFFPTLLLIVFNVKEIYTFDSRTGEGCNALVRILFRNK